MSEIIFGATGGGASLLACGLAVAMVVRYHRAYRKQSAAMRAGEIPMYAAYKNLALSGKRIALTVTISSSLVALAAVVVLSMQTFYPTLSVFVGMAICIVIAPCLLLSHFLFDFLALIYVDTPALAEFQGAKLAVSEVMARCLRGLLVGQPLNDRREKSSVTVSVPTFLLLETTGMLFLLDHRSMLWIIPVVAAAYRIVYDIGAAPLQKWVAHTESLEQTPYAPLEERLRKLAERLDIEPGSMRMHSMMRVGSVGSRVSGWRRCHLFLSEIFLKNSDWRQQDVWLATLLVIRLKKLLFIFHYLLNVAQNALVWVFVVIAASLLAAINSSVSSTLFLNTLVALCVAYALLRYASTFLLKKRMKGLYRAIAELTGDPLAHMIMMNTSGLLSSMAADRYGAKSGSMRRLAQVARQPGPRAPWAKRPVPSIAPLQIDSMLLTVPLEQAPRPEPIADAPYPEQALDALPV